MSDFNWIEWAKELISMGCEWLCVDDYEEFAYLIVENEITKVVVYCSGENAAWIDNGESALEYAIREDCERRGWYRNVLWKDHFLHLSIVDETCVPRKILVSAKRMTNELEALAVAYLEAVRGQHVL